ncbi:MAG: CD225/dispanin family protein [Bacteroidales bacterium]|nr:CD225/dispanin family protein [Bacteroidales bacterium]
MKYWANINGVQHGPVEKQQLIGLGLTRDSYVWREGLEDWVMVQNFSELDDLFPVKPMADVPPTDDGNYTAAAETPRCEPLTEETPADEPDEDETPADDTVPPAIPQIPQIPQQPYQQPVAPQQPLPPCPPTNLVWGILTTVLCCQVLGIVSIVYALQVKAKYDSGDLETAQRYSDRAAMWSIAAIVAGLIVTPFVMLVQLL